MKDDPFKIQEGNISHKKLKQFSASRNSGDYLDFLGEHGKPTLGIFFDRRKIFLLFLIFNLILCLLLSRGFYLQVVRGDYFRDLAEGNRTREDIIQANRGLIYDRFGNLLVKNVSHFFLYWQPDDQENVRPDDQILRQVADILSFDFEQLKERINDQPDESAGRPRIILYENIPYEQAMQLMLLAEEYPALAVDYEPRRQYFSYLGLAHALGYLGAVSEQDLLKKDYHYNDWIGKTGLEYVYEDVLRGRNGIREIEVDALNQEKNILSWSEPQDGQDLVLTVDAKAQGKLYEIMSSLAVSYQIRKMAAVVLDARDGGVLAMISLPTYDNNIFSTYLNQQDYDNILLDPSTPLLNRAISGTYPFGSVFKPIVAAAALEEKIVDQNFTVVSTGGVTIGNDFFPDWRPGGHGRTDITWALADSVNTFFYTVGGGNNQWLDFGLGAEKIVDYAKKFGLGQTTGIDLNAEAQGFLPTKEWKEQTIGERWYLGDTYNLSIGQGYMLGTPVQMAMMMSYFASGQSYRPHFIKEVKLGEQSEIYQPQLVWQNLISQDNLNTIRSGLRKTVVSGTAKSLQSVSVSVAGKTGTAQFNRNKSPHSWFASFAPYENPEIVVVTLAEEGSETGLAITVARQFMEWYFDR